MYCRWLLTFFTAASIVLSDNVRQIKTFVSSSQPLYILMQKNAS